MAHVFFDQRLVHRGIQTLFTRLENLSETAYIVHDHPDSGPWETRKNLRINTFSSMMCWAACDRMARIAVQLKQMERAVYWREKANEIHATICKRAWNEKKQSFTAGFEGDILDASLLLIHDIGFLSADDPRFSETVAAIEKELKHDNYIYRYVEPDDFGVPENAFVVCTFWYIYALAALNRVEEARDLFINLLSKRNRHGLLAEHIDSRTGEPWGNFVQTYSMVGLINSAIRLSKRWDSAF